MDMDKETIPLAQGEDTDEASNLDASEVEESFIVPGTAERGQANFNTEITSRGSSQSSSSDFMEKWKSDRERELENEINQQHNVETTGSDDEYPVGRWRHEGDEWERTMDTRPEKPPDMVVVERHEYGGGREDRVMDTYPAESRDMDTRMRTYDQDNRRERPMDFMYVEENTTTTEDILNRKGLAQQITSYLIENPSLELPFTIGICAPWGSGKSHIIKLIKESITTDKSAKDHVPVITAERVNCCLCTNWCPWITKLACIALLLVASILLTLSAPLIWHSMRCRAMIDIDESANQTTPPLNGSSDSNTSLQKDGDECSKLSYNIGISLAVFCIFLICILSTACCQRKVFKDMCKLNWTANSKVSVNDRDITQGRNSATCCVHTKLLCFMSFYKPVSFSPSSNSEPKIKIINVDLNAWEYAGCDHLWAGIVTTLGSQIEGYFGKWKVRMFRLATSYFANDGEDRNPRSLTIRLCNLRIKLYMLIFLVTYVLIICGGLFTVVQLTDGKPFANQATYICMVTFFSTMVAVSVIVGKIFQVILQSTESLVQKICEDMKGDDFQQELGFMHRVKQEVQHISDILAYMSNLHGVQYRVLLIIDDLDRCKPSRIMPVLEAMVLLLEPKDDQSKSPYISILAYDSRVIMGAIESYFDPAGKSNLEHANVNGYEYLKKIIHLPISFPPPNLVEKKAFIKYVTCGVADDLEEDTQDKAGSDLAEEYVATALRNPGLLHFINGNPRSLKRICNILTLVLSMPKFADSINTWGADEAVTRDLLLLVYTVILVEQWQFRTSFLRQAYLNKKQKYIRLPYDFNMKSLRTIWLEERGKVMKIEAWRKHMRFDYDPELFEAFLHYLEQCHLLNISELDDKMNLALNHDANIEYFVEQGLAELDLKSCEDLL